MPFFARKMPTWPNSALSPDIQAPPWASTTTGNLSRSGKYRSSLCLSSRVSA